MSEISNFMDQVGTSILGLFNLLDVDGKLKKFITLLSLISFLAAFFPFLFDSTIIYRKTRRNLPALLIQSISVGIKLSSLWAVFTEISNFGMHVGKLKETLKNGNNSYSNSTDTLGFLSAATDTTFKIFSQKSVYFPLLTAGVLFTALQITTPKPEFKVNEKEASLADPLRTTLWYLLPFFILSLTESVMIELFKANVFSDSYRQAVILRYVIRGLSVGCGLRAIRSLPTIYGFFGAIFYSLSLFASSAFAQFMREYILKDLSKDARLEDTTYQIINGIRFGATSCIIVNYLVPELFSQIDYFYISILAIVSGFTAMKEHLDIDSNVVDGHFAPKNPAQ